MSFRIWARPSVSVRPRSRWRRGAAAASRARAQNPGRLGSEELAEDRLEPAGQQGVAVGAWMEAGHGQAGNDAVVEVLDQEDALPPREIAKPLAVHRVIEVAERGVDEDDGCALLDEPPRDPPERCQGLHRRVVV